MYQFTGNTNVNISISLISVKVITYKFVHGEKIVTLWCANSLMHLIFSRTRLNEGIMA